MKDTNKTIELDMWSKVFQIINFICMWFLGIEVFFDLYKIDSHYIWFAIIFISYSTSYFKRFLLNNVKK
jgi:hypothetical protein